MRKTGSVPNLMTIKLARPQTRADTITILKVNNGQSTATYKDINETSKKMFLEQMQRKWIERGKSTNDLSSEKQALRPRTTMKTQRNISQS